MKNIIQWLLLSLLFGSGAFFANGFAQEQFGTWYFGSEMGFTGFDDYQYDDTYKHGETGGFSFGLVLGYDINKHLSVQAGIHSVSSINFKIRCHDDEVIINDDPTSDYNTTEVMLIGKIPVGRHVTLFGLAGIQHFDFKRDYLRNFDYQHMNTDGNELLLGFGVEWFYNKNLFSRITFRGSDIESKYHDARSTRSSELDQGQVTFLIGYRFN